MNPPYCSWMVATHVTDIPFWFAFLENLKKGLILEIWKYSSPYQINYNTQFCDDPTIQHFMWGYSLEFKLENNKGSGSDGLHVRNQVTFNDKIGAFGESYMDTVSMV